MRKFLKRKNKLIFTILVCVVGFMGCTESRALSDTANRVRDFDEGWHFIKDSIIDASQPDYDDTKWRILNLPHDWSIEDLPAGDGVIGPFTKNSGGPMDGKSTAHTLGGTGWYRKKFVLQKEDAAKHIQLYFEGAYMETDVWVNGKKVGSHKHGYTSFFFDITTFLNVAGQENSIAVRVANKGQNSRWYSGSGLYRHVKLIVTNPVMITQWGVQVTTPQVTTTAAVVKIASDIVNNKNEIAEIKIKARLLDADNKTAGETEIIRAVPANGKINVVQQAIIKSPKLWSPDSAYLYKAEVSVWLNEKLEDKTTIPFGVRTISFSAEKGFLLNGQTVKLKGGCVHHDNGVLGAAAIDRAEERKVELLKAAGFNAIRCSHNPPSEKFLETCDRLGMLVIDEVFDMWQKPKNKDDYHLFFNDWWQKDLAALVLRDRNHPSVIFWSLGNEIEERAEPSGVELMKKFKSVLYKCDSSRPLTMAVCEFWDHNNLDWAYTAPAFAQIDVGGYNYQWWQYENDHKKFPKRIMMGTESVPQQALQNWNLVEKHPYVIGDFVWTAMDYLGESGIGHTACDKGVKDPQLADWPWFNANCGDIDLIGNKKPQSYYRDVVWRRSKIEMAVHAPLPPGCKEIVSYWGWPDELNSWTWPGNEGKMMSVNVYSRSKKIRLLLNGKVVGEKMVDSLLTARFELPYEPGELKAIALDDEKETANTILQTTGKPAALRLKADRKQIKADRNDLAYITVEVIDENGNVVPNAIIPVEFTLTGAGEIAGVGNANPKEMASFKLPQRNTFRGRCLVVVMPNGKPGDIKLTARSAGIKTAEIVVTTK